ncbi:AVID protein, partial [Penelope pileata]|nr:AVID protein [Penelope pileata]
CVLTGNWTNDLGSNMTIGTVDDNGGFTGTYNTSVSVAQMKIKPSLLHGMQ